MKHFATRRFLDLRRSLGKGAGRAGANGDMSAFASQFFSDSSAQAFAGCCDYSHAATEPQIHSTSQFKPAILSQNTGRRQRPAGRRILFAWRAARH